MSSRNMPLKSIQHVQDHGWAFVVLVGSFTTNMIVDAVSFSTGLFFLEFQEYYQSSASVTAWAGALLNGMYLGTGPIASTLSNRFDCRRVAMAGSVLASVSFILSTFCPNIYLLVFAYAVAGTGFGLMYLPAIVMVGLYFNRLRALATGIAMTGSGIGIFSFAPLWEFLIIEYGWKGTSWILAAIVLHCLAVGAIYRPIVPITVAEKEEETCIGREKNIGNEISDPCDEAHIQKAYTRREEGSYKINKDDNSQSPSSTQDAQSSLLQLPSSDKPGLSAELYIRSGTGVYRRVSKVLRRNPHISLLCHSAFVLYGLTRFLGAAGFFIPVTYLPAFAVQQGLSRTEAALLISIIGIANILSRIIIGWIADQKWANSLVIHNFALITSGLSIIMCPFCQHFWSLGISAAVFGASTGVVVIMNPILMVDLLGVEQLSNSFGLVSFFHGIACLVGPPFAGYLYDKLGTYTASFFLAGAILCLSGLLSIPLRQITLWHERRQTIRGLKVVKT